MANSVDIQKKVYNKQQASTVIDREFKTYAPPVPVQDPDTVEELFRLYNKLFYTIPVEGEINSHQYLLKKSSELANFDRTTEEFQPLLDEIGQLRQQLLNANQQIFDLQNQLGGNA
jgi:hypothetical protein